MRPTCPPVGVVTTSRPLLPFTVRILPLLGSVVRPSGSFRVGLLDTVTPIPALEVRLAALGIAAIRLSRLSATYSVPVADSPSPVGPMTSAAGSVLSGNPEPIVVMDTTDGMLVCERARLMRTTVPSSTRLPLPATVSLSTLVTNRSAVVSMSNAVISQGPLMRLLKIVSTTVPAARDAGPGPESRTAGKPARHSVSSRQTPRRAGDEPGRRSRPRRPAVEPLVRRPASESGTSSHHLPAAADPRPAPPPPFAAELSPATRHAHTRYPERAAPPAHPASTPAESPHGYPAGCASGKVCGAPAPAPRAAVRRHQIGRA